MSGKSQGNFMFFKVRELSGNFANCQGNLGFWVNVRGGGGDSPGILKKKKKKKKKKKNRFKFSYLVTE